MIWIFLIFVAVLIAMKVYDVRPKEILTAGVVSVGVFLFIIAGLMAFLSLLLVVSGGFLLL